RHSIADIIIRVAHATRARRIRICAPLIACGSGCTDSARSKVTVGVRDALHVEPGVTTSSRRERHCSGKSQPGYLLYHTISGPRVYDDGAAHIAPNGIQIKRASSSGLVATLLELAVVRSPPAPRSYR